MKSQLYTITFASALALTLTAACQKKGEDAAAQDTMNASVLIQTTETDVASLSKDDACSIKITERQAGIELKQYSSQVQCNTDYDLKSLLGVRGRLVTARDRIDYRSHKSGATPSQANLLQAYHDGLTNSLRAVDEAIAKIKNSKNDPRFLSALANLRGLACDMEFQMMDEYASEYGSVCFNGCQPADLGIVTTGKLFVKVGCTDSADIAVHQKRMTALNAFLEEWRIPEQARRIGSDNMTKLGKAITDQLVAAGTSIKELELQGLPAQVAELEKQGFVVRFHPISEAELKAAGLPIDVASFTTDKTFGWTREHQVVRPYLIFSALKWIAGDQAVRETMKKNGINKIYVTSRESYLYQPEDQKTYPDAVVIDPSKLEQVQVDVRERAQGLRR